MDELYDNLPDVLQNLVREFQGSNDITITNTDDTVEHINSDVLHKYKQIKHMFVRKTITITYTGLIEWDGHFSHLISIEYGVDANVILVGNMRGLFEHAEHFNGDISKWDTSKVNNMARMFAGAVLFNSDISKWDVSNVKDMRVMFYGAHSFNRDISKWNTRKVNNMARMFSDAYSFNFDISRWKVPNRYDREGMFHNTRALEHDMRRWNSLLYRCCIN
jgi:surface protein